MNSEKAHPTTIVLALVHSPDIWGQWTGGRPLHISMDILHGVAEAMCSTGEFTYIKEPALTEQLVKGAPNEKGQEERAVVLLPAQGHTPFITLLVLWRKARWYREIWVLAPLQNWMQAEVDRSILRQCDRLTFLACSPNRDCSLRISYQERTWKHEKVKPTDS